MARAPSPAAKTAKPAAPRNAATAPRSLIWLQGLLYGAVVTLATASALLGAILLAPAVLASRLDDEPGRPIARVVLVCGLAGAIHPLYALWQGGHTIGFAVFLLGDMRVLALAWGAGIAGWFIAELAPVGVRVGLELSALTRTTRLRAQRAQLERDWGIAPAEPTE